MSATTADGTAAAASAAAMDVDAGVPEKVPSLSRVRSSQGSSAVGTPTGKKRGGPSTPAHSRKPSVTRPRSPSPTPTTTQKDEWLVEEHDAVIESVWRFGVRSSAAATGAAGSLVASAVLESPERLSLANKTSDQSSAYVRALVWEVYASYAYAAPLLQPVSGSFGLDAPFLEHVVRAHHLLACAPDTASDTDQPQLVAPIALPKCARPIVSPSGDESREHAVLSAWGGRLRRHFLLRACLETGGEADLRRVLESIQSADGDANTAEARALLPAARWSIEQDEALLRQGLVDGYGSFKATPTDTEATGAPSSTNLFAERLDYILDEFQRQCIVLEEDDASSTVSEENHLDGDATMTDATNDTTPSAFASAAHSSLVWTPSLVRNVVGVLQTRGLPVLPYASAVVNTASTTPTPALVPALPFIDWRATRELLAHLIPTHEGQDVDDAAWSAPLANLLHHAAAEFERETQAAISGGTHSDVVRDACAAVGLAPAAASSPLASTSSSLGSLLPPSLSTALRRSLLFWHQLRVRILDVGFHGFAASATLVEWVSQYAPGLLEATPAPTSNGASAADEFGGALANPLRATPTLRAHESLHAPSGAASQMPTWWQIGLHDLCLLQAVDRAGLDPDALLNLINQDIAAAPTAAAEPVDAAAAEAVEERVHWSAEALWLLHSRPIIRQRMGVADSVDVAERPPPVTPLTRAELPAILKRLAQLVPALTAVATDELMNRLLQSVEIAPAAANEPTTPSPAASPAPAFVLAPAAAVELHYYTRTLPGYAAQAELFGLLKTRYHELRPGSHKARLQAVHARRHQPGGGASLLAAEGAPPENPLKLADAAFLRPTSRSLSSTACRPLAPFADASFTAVGGHPPEPDSDEPRELDARTEQTVLEEGGNESVLAALIDARRRKAHLARRIERLLGDHERTQLPPTPAQMVIRDDGRLALPQHLEDGFVLHTLGTVSSSHLPSAQPAATSNGVTVKMEDSPVKTETIETKADATPESDAMVDVKPEGIVSAPLVLYPIGYRALVRHQSYTRVDTLAWYLCEIVLAETNHSHAAAAAAATTTAPQLLFRVTASDDTLGSPICGATPQSVWDEVASRVLLCELDAPLVQRQLPPVDGHERFGLTHTAVAHALAIEARADEEVARAIVDRVGPEVVAAHVAALPPAQFYLTEAPPADSTIYADEDSLRSALERTWSHNLLRYRSLASSLLADETSLLDPASAGVSPTAAHAQAQAAAAHAHAHEEKEHEARAAHAAAVQAAAQAAHAAAVSAAGASAVVAPAPTMYAAPPATAYFPQHYGMAPTHAQFSVPTTHPGWSMEAAQSAPAAAAAQQHQQMYVQQQMAYMHHQQHAAAMQAHAAQQAPSPYLPAAMIANAAAAVNAQTS